MKKVKRFFLYLLTVIILVNCAGSPRRYDFTLKNTLSIFMLNNEKGNFFCIPVQYTGDYQINKFEFNSGFITVGNFKIPLKKDEINIYIYFAETQESGSPDEEFRLIYSQENGSLLLSLMDELNVSEKNESGGIMNYYYIFIEKYPDEDEIKKIISEYERGNINSCMGIEYDLIIDNEELFGNGMYDNFELYNGAAMDSAWFPPNLDFFKEKYLK